MRLDFGTSDSIDKSVALESLSNLSSTGMGQASIDLFREIIGGTSESETI